MVGEAVTHAREEMVEESVTPAREAVAPDRQEVVRLVRIAGVLLLTGAVFSVPSAFVLEPNPPVTDFFVSTSGFAFSLLFLFVPAARIHRGWIAFCLAAGIVLTAAAVAATSDDYAFFYVVVAIYAAFALRTRRELIAFTAVITVALLAPLVYAEEFRTQLHHILVTAPVLAISLIFVRYLRETLESRERAYRGFAAEAIEIAQRIRDRSRASLEGITEEQKRLDELAERARAEQAE